MTIKRSENRNGSVKVYATVPSESRPGIEYRVVYIRSKSFRGCVCTCEDFLLNKLAKNRNCKHIKGLRRQYGRFFSQVPR